MNNLPRKHLVLIGLRGSGKSTLGRALAAALGAPCTDLDERTAARLGATTAGEAFRRFGESAFRAAESEALDEALNGALDEELDEELGEELDEELGEALAATPRILALGGGTPTAPGAADLIACARREGRAYVVFLDPPLDVLASRLNAERGDRPSLTGRGVIEEMEEIAARRRPLYAALADLVVGRDACDGVSERSQAAALERVVRAIVTGFCGADSGS